MKEYKISFRVNSKEKEQIQNFTKNKSRSQIIRMCIQQYIHNHAYIEKLEDKISFNREILHQLSRVCGNLNTVAKNSDENYKKIIDELKIQVLELIQLTNKNNQILKSML